MLCVSIWHNILIDSPTFNPKLKASIGFRNSMDDSPKNQDTRLHLSKKLPGVGPKKLQNQHNNSKSLSFQMINTVSIKRNHEINGNELFFLFVNYPLQGRVKSII